MSLSSRHRDMGIPINFQEESGIVPFEALNSACLSRCQRVVTPPIGMRHGPRAFSRESTRDSVIPSSCEMKDEPTFKSEQGYPGFFRGRASWCPFHLRQHTQEPSHIPITERSLHLRCLWKVGILLESKPGNQLSSRDDLWYTELVPVAAVTSGSL